jgi:Na+/proline symporter
MTMNSENTVGLYIAVAIYFLFLAAASVIAYRWKKHSSESKPVESQSDAIEGHFLADRSFGWLVTAGTVFVR